MGKYSGFYIRLGGWGFAVYLLGFSRKHGTIFITWGAYSFIPYSEPVSLRDEGVLLMAGVAHMRPTESDLECLSARLDVVESFSVG